MEIKLNDDFSGVQGVDYVKILELPYDKQAETIAYLAAIPTHAAALSYNKTKAIDNFVKGLKTNSLWAKISGVYIPLFGQSEGGVNLMNPASNIGFPSDPGIATYSSKGITFLVGWASAITLNRRINTLGFYNTESSDNIGTQASMALSSILLGRNTVSLETALLITGTVRPRVLSHSSFIGAVIGTIDTTLGFTSIIADGVDSVNTAVTNTDIASATPFALVLGGSSAGTTTNRAKYAHGFFTYSTVALTLSEKTIYAGLVKTLMETLTAA